jgi:pyruvate formate lyase activating enzyme
MEEAIVVNIQGYSIHDGPGIRTVVFLKGCPLRCAWCANPENLTPKPDIGFIHTLCRACGRCLDACEYGAVRAGGAYRINRGICARCFHCLDVCHYGALVRYGSKMTSDELYETVRRDRMFFDSSGGGVTVSGGEPLLAATFVRELCARLRADGIGTCIETCGFAPWSAFETVLPEVDMTLFDIKFADDGAHVYYTGKSNALILENAQRLALSGAAVLFRRPLIPGVNDGDEETERSAEFLRSIGAASLELMPYHRMGQSKYAALDMPYRTAQIDVAPPEEVNAIRDKYIALGVACTVSR